MGTVLSLLIIAAAVFVGIGTKKFHDRPHIVNFSIAALMLLIVVRTFTLQPVSTLGWAAVAICSIALVVQMMLGFKNVNSAR